MLAEQKQALLERLVAARAAELAAYADPGTAVAGAIKFSPMLDDLVTVSEQPASDADVEAVYAAALDRARALHSTVIAAVRAQISAPQYAGMTAEQLCEALMQRERVTVPGRTGMQAIVDDALSQIPARPADLLVTADGTASIALVQQMIDQRVAASGKTREELLVREDSYMETGPVPWVAAVAGVPYARNVPKIDLIREALDGR